MLNSFIVRKVNLWMLGKSIEEGRRKEEGKEKRREGWWEDGRIAGSYSLRSWNTCLHLPQSPIGGIPPNWSGPHCVPHTRSLVGAD